jgi:hypothetical protein
MFNPDTPMKHIAILLNGPVRHDGRVIRVIRYLSSRNKVFLFYVNGDAEDADLFNDNVRLFPCRSSHGLKNKIIKHSFFFREFLFFIPAVLKTEIVYDYIYANDLPCLLPAKKIKEKLGNKPVLVYDANETITERPERAFILLSYSFYEKTRSPCRKEMPWCC